MKHSRRHRFFVFSLGIVLLALRAHAGSAIWNLNPADNNWNNAANWTPAIVPNGPNDIATFAVSNTTAISITKSIQVQSVVFMDGASAFTITANPPNAVTFVDGGITNSSGIAQNFVTTADTDASSLGFTGAATIGDDIVITNNSSTVAYIAGGATSFADTASAGTALIINNGGLRGSSTYFSGSATAANATIIANGATLPNLGVGAISFEDANPGNATLIANGATGQGGYITFNGTVSNTARVEIYDNASLYTGYDKDSAVGSVEGNGLIVLALSYNLTVGKNNLNTTFSGVIEDDPNPPIIPGRARQLPGKAGGALTKVGTGTLTLTGANTFSAGATVSSGQLNIQNGTDTAGGAGLVKVKAGTLSGGSIIKKAVTIGTGSGTGAILAPGQSPTQPSTLTIQSTITFEVDGTYSYLLNTKKAKGNTVIANGVTIDSGAQFSFNRVANKKLTVDTVFTAISNTSSTPISGTFANLPDNSTFTSGRNNYQANYAGGDGNDLTLTVVP